MTILNFGFNKIVVERKTRSAKQINIESGLHIKDVKASEMVKNDAQKAFTISFGFDVKYEPGLGNISIEGELLYLSSNDQAKEISDLWEKNKSLPKQVGVVIFNRILQQCNVEALILSREVNLPAPIQLPKVSTEPAPAKTIAKKNVPK